MITLCGSTYAKFVCSIILKQPSYTLMCSSFIEFKLQVHLILESNSSRILFFFFTILIIPHHPSFFKLKATKKINLLQLIYQYFRLVRRFYLMEQVVGIEPTSSAWKAEVLPLNYTCIYKVNCQDFGAGSGNRTHVISLEGWGSTIELHLHFLLTIIDYKCFFYFCQYLFEILFLIFCFY